MNTEAKIEHSVSKKFSKPVCNTDLQAGAELNEESPDDILMQKSIGDAKIVDQRLQIAIRSMLMRKHQKDFQKNAR